MASRTREIGLRIALGAERKDVIGRVVGSAVRFFAGGGKRCHFGRGAGGGVFTGTAGIGD